MVEQTGPPQDAIMLLLSMNAEAALHKVQQLIDRNDVPWRHRDWLRARHETSRSITRFTPMVRLGLFGMIE